MLTDEGQFDTTIEIVTPENIAFRYQLAGPFRRLPAYLIDLTLRAFLAALGALVLGMVSGLVGFSLVGMGMSLVLWFLLAWFYGGLFETFYNGQTPGKRMMRLRVLSVDGQPINALQAVLRNVLRSVDAQPVMFYQLGLLTAAMNDRFQRLGDLACGTMVVVEQQAWFQDVLRTGEPEVGRMAERIPAGFRVSRTMGRALAAYVQRRRAFAWPRRLEIARHLGEPLRREFSLPANTNLDLLLCGLYHRTFIAERAGEAQETDSPLAAPTDPPARLTEVT